MYEHQNTSFSDDLPHFDQYDDDYVLQTEPNLADKSATSL